MRVPIQPAPLREQLSGCSCPRGAHGQREALLSGHQQPSQTAALAEAWRHCSGTQAGCQVGRTGTASPSCTFVYPCD